MKTSFFHVFTEKQDEHQKKSFNIHNLYVLVKLSMIHARNFESLWCYYFKNANRAT